ncbi:DUF5906 domain-containing protein [Uliginosibacterium sp. 31-16]|uniref:DUF5906 domain-containing protein n=1 Tax=Uliginosibacterium sp. 31-16 TaxID=3068315 RepID=UPI00273FEE7C|nr:DUF5906 domain-containing protein [Uliginosibacterium sp. 31-16]MDP5239911.1 DUF5906 domain-containing protein [Uliginosibacterium sp. 31-16]
MSKENSPEERDAIEAKYRELARSFIKDHDLYFMAPEGRYYMWLPSSLKWSSLPEQSLRAAHPEYLSNDRWRILLGEMKAAKRNRHIQRCTFLPVTDDEMNIMKWDHWLKPIEGRTENTKWFDYLIQALGNSTPDNMLHIRQVLGWKYMHPEDTQIPCLCFYGEGGAGKNLLADKVLPVVFGAGSTWSGLFEAVKSFNGQLAGKVIVNFNEAADSKLDNDYLKNLVGAPVLQVNEKHQRVYSADNIALYMISTNNVTGAVKVENNSSNRRWSLLKISRALVAIVAEAEGVDVTTAKAMISSAVSTVWTNPTEVAHFLYDCVVAATGLGVCPPAHQPEAEMAALRTCDSADEIIQSVFVDDSRFEFITVSMLYDLYKQHSADSSPGATPRGKQKFNAYVSAYIEQHGLPVGKAEKVNVKMSTGGFQTAQVWFSKTQHAGGPTKLKENSGYYEQGRFRYVDTEIAGSERMLSLVMNFAKEGGPMNAAPARQSAAGV